MKMRSALIVTAIVLALPLISAAPARAAADADGFTDSFNVPPQNFTSVGRSDYVVLEPGFQLVYITKDGDKGPRLVSTVLPETQTIAGVETRVLESVEISGELPRRVTRQYIAMDKPTGDVYLFGRSVDRYDGWRDAGHAGSWHAGEYGARFGMILAGKPAAGQKYYQSLAGRVVTDRVEVLSVNEAIKVPAMRFERCVKVAETTPTNPKRVNEKFFAPGVGLISDSTWKLFRYGQNVEPRPDAAKLVARAKERAKANGEATEPIIAHDLAREALAGVGADPHAEEVWKTAINDPAMSPKQRSDLIEDLNETGFEDPSNVQPNELPIVLNRLALIEDLAPDAMDDTNAAAFAEAHKDLTRIAERLSQ
jgi:hypothetical protein